MARNEQQTWRPHFEMPGKREADLIRSCGQYLVDHAEDIAYKGGFLAEDGIKICVNLGDGSSSPTITVAHEMIVTKQWR